MHRSRMLGVSSGVVAAVLAVTIGVALAAPSGGSHAAAPAFRIRGHIARLYPGANTKMQMRVRNLESFRIVVTSVVASIAPASSSCPAGAIRVKPWTGHMRVSPRGVARLRIRVRMRRTAPLACRGERWPIAYAGKAFRP